MLRFFNKYGEVEYWVGYRMRCVSRANEFFNDGRFYSIICCVGFERTYVGYQLNYMFSTALSESRNPTGKMGIYIDKIIEAFVELRCVD